MEGVNARLLSWIALKELYYMKSVDQKWLRLGNFKQNGEMEIELDIELVGLGGFYFLWFKIWIILFSIEIEWREISGGVCWVFY